MISKAVTGMTVHAAGYTRQSAARQNKSEASPASQRAADKVRSEGAVKAACDLGGYVGGKAPYGRTLRREIRTSFVMG
jgi:hypothetical protein